MSEAMTKGGEVMREIASLTTGVSETASSKEAPLFGPSGSMTYRVEFERGDFVDVNAASGDLAAEEAHRQRPGNKVIRIAPALAA